MLVDGRSSRFPLRRVLCSGGECYVLVALLGAALLGSGRRRVRQLSVVPSQRHASLSRVLRRTAETVCRSFAARQPTVSTLPPTVPQLMHRSGQCCYVFIFISSSLSFSYNIEVLLPSFSSLDCLLILLSRGKSGPALGGTEYRLTPSACRLIVRAKL